MASYQSTGRKAQVAEAMADGDKFTGIGGKVRPATSAEIGAKLGLQAVYVRATQRRIYRDLGPQATELDLGWRGGKIWHPGR